MANPTLQITVTQGPDEGKQLSLEAGKTYLIGCGAEDHLVLTDPMVLKGHCSLEATADGAILRNHTASAGTFIGQKKISQARVPGKATFRIGDSHIQIRPARAPQPTSPTTPKSAAPKTGASSTAPAGAAASSPRRGGPNDPLLGKIVGGYKLEEVVGRGGMGTVYRAVQLSLQREVALKVLARKYARDDNFRNLFINEARAAAQLVHPNIVQVYDAGIEGDVSFFSMEYISQGSVEEILKRDKQIPWEEAILMVLEAAHGLQYAEGKQIVHRDIKPDNLMLNADGRIKIADLGLAKQGEGGADQGIIGTPHFIPPEQALGKNVDTRADIYSLGATFFRMITGRTLFTGKTAKEIVLKHIKEPAPAASSVVSDLPGELDGVIAKMLAKDPDARYASAGELVEALETVCAHHGIKGSVIKRGVSKKVLVPLFVLLIGAAYAIFSLANKNPEVYVDPALVAKQKADQEQRAKAEQAQREAERNLRRGRVVTAYSQLQQKFAENGGIKGVQQHRDGEDKDEYARLEAQYEEFAKRYEAFAKREDVVEFDSELGTVKKANDKAKEIRDTIKEVKETEASKGQQINDWVAAAAAIYKKERDALGKFSVAQQFSDAFLMAARLSRTKPGKDDPFEVLLTQEWVSPLNPKIKQSAHDTKRVTDIVTKAREFFAQEKNDIPDRAEAAWKAVEAQVPPAAQIAAANVGQLEKSIKLLDPVIETYGNAENKIKDCWDAAQSRRRLIVEELKKRKQQRILTDRAAVRDTLRAQRSLDPDVRPNNVMEADFAAARSAWQRLLDSDTVKSEQYMAFVRERIEALRYIEYLFSQFRADLIKTDGMRDSNDAPLRSRACEFTLDTRPFRFKLEKPEDGKTDRFFMSKKYKGNDSFPYAKFGMDWIYESILRVPGGNPNELRWREPTPVVRFALAMFLFETMQYGDAVEMFTALANDPTYGAVATSFAERARLETAARAEYEALLKAGQEATTSDQVQKVMKELSQYGKKHAATLFWVDVMPHGQALAVDIAPAADAQVAPLPAAPAPPVNPVPEDK